MSQPGALAYDTAAASAVWRRVAPALPAYETGVTRSPTVPPTDEAALRRLIDCAAEAHRACRRCTQTAPNALRGTFSALAYREADALRALLGVHFLLTGRCYAPAAAPAGEGFPAALRSLYRAERQRSEGCAALAEALRDETLRRRLDTLAQEAEARSEIILRAAEKALTFAKNLLKW